VPQGAAVHGVLVSRTVAFGKEATNAEAKAKSLAVLSNRQTKDLCEVHGKRLEKIFVKTIGYLRSGRMISW
jgi:hypothetical protein